MMHVSVKSDILIEYFRFYGNEHSGYEVMLKSVSLILKKLYTQLLFVAEVVARTYEATGKLVSDIQHT